VVPSFAIGLSKPVEPFLLENTSSGKGGHGTIISDPFTTWKNPFRRVLGIGISFMPLWAWLMF